MYNPYKMRIKIFIVTYNSAKYLNENVRTLVESTVVNYDYEINIINNHSNFHLDEYFLNNFNIPNIDIVFLQAGVGSWPASCIWYYINRYNNKRPKLVLVEPENSSGILQSFISNKRITPLRNVDTIMAGLNCGIPSKSGWEIIKNGCDAVLTISDNYAKKAMKMLFSPIKSDKRIISGESGAAGLAGLIKCLNSKNYVDLKEHIGLDSSSRILIFSTEGNTDKDSFNSIINEK